ncbi:MAG: hypothetical protein LIP04_14345 [Tannerellaceae bacterium]|nr:hypothetical protein [Tannerellaceae bacterium]
MRNQRRSFTKPRTVSDLNTCIYTVIVSLLCWIVGYGFSVGYPVYGEITAPPLWNAICRILLGKTITYLTGFLLMAGGAFMIHRANFVLMLIREKTYLPFALYMLLISTNPDFFPLTATSAGIFCLILSIYQLFVSYHMPDATSRVFNITFIIGTGSLLWVHILWFIPLCWYGMYTFKIWNIRTFLASLLGVGTVYWFLLGWCVWTRDFTPFTVPFPTLLKVGMLSFTDVGWIHWIGLLYVSILTLIASGNIITHDYADALRTRQFLWFLIVFVVLAFLLFLSYGQESDEFLGVACLPASILLAHFFTLTHRKIVFWIYHFSVVLFVILIFVRLWNFSSVTGI